MAKKKVAKAKKAKKAKKFQVDWSAGGSCEVKADSFDEAFDKFNSDPAKYGAPANAEAVDWGEDEDQEDDDDDEDGCIP